MKGLSGSRIHLREEFLELLPLQYIWRNADL
jgi:hypothetical protein